jgi:hypothetical protein
MGHINLNFIRYTQPSLGIRDLLFSVSCSTLDSRPTGDDSTPVRSIPYEPVQPFSGPQEPRLNQPVSTTMTRGGGGTRKDFNNEFLGLFYLVTYGLQDVDMITYGMTHAPRGL